MEKIAIKSRNELQAFAKKLSNSIATPAVFFLVGEMGSGKTTFVQYFTESLGYAEPVRSPSFIIHSEYSIQGKNVHHIDLYRLTTNGELSELKLSDTITAKSYIFIEWADMFEDDLVKIFKNKTDIYYLKFTVVNENSRLIEFKKHENTSN